MLCSDIAIHAVEGLICLHSHKPLADILFGIGEVETLSQAFTQESLTAMKTFQHILKFVAQN